MSKWHQSRNYGTKKILLTHTRNRTRNHDQCGIFFFTAPPVSNGLNHNRLIFISLEALCIEKEKCRSSEASESDLLFHYLLANTRIPMARGPPVICHCLPITFFHYLDNYFETPEEPKCDHTLLLQSTAIPEMGTIGT